MASFAEIHTKPRPVPRRTNALARAAGLALITGLCVAPFFHHARAEQNPSKSVFRLMDAKPTSENLLAKITTGAPSEEAILTMKDSVRAHPELGDSLAKTLMLNRRALGDSAYMTILENWPFEAAYYELYPPRTYPWPYILALNKNIQMDTNFADRMYKKYESFDDSSLAKHIAGACIAAICFRNPALANKAAFGRLLSIDSSTSARIMESSPEWHYLEDILVRGLPSEAQQPYVIASFMKQISDNLRLLEIVEKHGGAPIVKTLFEWYNITSFGNYPMDVAEHLYFDKDKPTGAPLMAVVFTKCSQGAAFERIFGAFDYRNFDIRAIEPKNGIFDADPGSDSSLVALIEKISNALGKKFKFSIINGHGQPNAVLLKQGSGWLGLEDEELLRNMKRFFLDRCDVVLNSCATAREYGGMTIAEFIAKSLEARCFGTVGKPWGIRKITFNTTNTEVASVAYGDSGYETETKVYDYRTPQTRITGMQPVLVNQVIRRSVSIYIFSDVPQNSTGTIYDLSGRLIGRIRPDNSNALVWNATNKPNGLYVLHIPLADRVITVKVDKTR